VVRGTPVWMEGVVRPNPLLLVGSYSLLPLLAQLKHIDHALTIMMLVLRGQRRGRVRGGPRLGLGLDGGGRSPERPWEQQAGWAGFVGKEGRDRGNRTSLDPPHHPLCFSREGAEDLGLGGGVQLPAEEKLLD